LKTQQLENRESKQYESGSRFGSESPDSHVEIPPLMIKYDIRKISSANEFKFKKKKIKIVAYQGLA